MPQIHCAVLSAHQRESERSNHEKPEDYPRGHRLSKTVDRSARILSDVAELLLDTKKLIVFRDTVGATGRSCLDLACTGCHGAEGRAASDGYYPRIAGKPAGYLKSSGIAHATKSKIEVGVAGKDGLFDDIKVWNAAPLKP